MLTEGKLKNKEADANSANLPFRGVSPSAPHLRKSFKIEEGRMMREGTNEIMVGDGVVANYENIAVGKTVRWGNADWEVVGRFSDDGGIAESEAWADARLVQQVWNRGTSFQSVRVRLTDESEATFKKLKDKLTKNPQLQVAVTREPQFYAEQQEMMSTLITGAGVFFAILMGLAAIFAAVNTMLNAVAVACARNRHVARDGFRRRAGGVLGHHRGAGAGRCRWVARWPAGADTAQRHAEFDDEFPDVQPDHLRVHGDARLDGRRHHLRTGAHVRREHPPGHSRGAHAHHRGAARIVSRRLSFMFLGALALTGASSFAHAEVWADVEGRIQYAYYTNDSRALNSMLTSLKPKAVEGEAKSGGRRRHARTTSGRSRTTASPRS